MSNPVSPLAPTSFPLLPEIAGVTLAAAATGIRYKNRPDVLLRGLSWSMLAMPMRLRGKQALQL
jgi:hypothetical protein